MIILLLPKVIASPLARRSTRVRSWRLAGSVPRVALPPDAERVLR